MAALDFPASSSSPWTAPNGVIYTWNTDGYWEAKADPKDFDTDYLKLNATNDPVTGNLALDQDLDVGDNLAVTGTSAFTGNVSAAANLAVTGTSAFTGLTTHAGGVNVAGNTIVSGADDTVYPLIYSENSQGGMVLTLKPRSANSTSSVNLSLYPPQAGGTGGGAVINHNKTLDKSQENTLRISGNWSGDYTVAGGSTAIFNSYLLVSADTEGSTTSTDKPITGIGVGCKPDANTHFVGVKSRGKPGSSPAAAEWIGVKSEIYPSDATTAYNFFAGGSAPNYFAGESSFFTTDETDTAYLGIIKNSANRGSLWAHTGNVLLGANPDQDLVTAGGTNATRLSYFQSQFSSNFNDLTTPGVQFIRSGGDSTEAARAIEFYRYSAYSGAIMVSSTDVAFAPSGDYRLKSNIVDLPSSADLIKQLKPRKYTIKGVPNKIGFVAHELQEVVPEAVFGTKDATEAIGTFADYDGTELETDVVEPPAEELTYTEEVETDGVVTMVTRARTWTPTGTRPVYQGVDQTKLIPLLVKSLQEALERIEALEAAAAG